MSERYALIGRSDDGLASRRELAVALHQRYLNGESTQVIADECKVSRQRIHQLFNEYKLPTRNRAEAGQLRYDQGRKRAQELAEPIRVSFSDYSKHPRATALDIIQLISTQMNVPQVAVREVLEDELALHGRHKPMVEPRYSDDELLSFMREAAVGNKLTTTRYAEYAEGRLTDDGRPWPAHLTIMLRFDKWSNACKRAGLQVSSRKRKRISADECVAALKQAIGKYGLLTLEEYREKSREVDGWPSPDLIRLRCGSWGEALKQAAQ